MGWLIWPGACVLVAAISFVLGGVYFRVAAEGARLPPPTAKVESLVALACRGGAFVATEDEGETMVVVTMEQNRVCRVRVYTPGTDGTGPGMWSDVGETVVSHVLDE